MPSNLEKKQPKYGKKTNFSREKQYAYSEEDIAKIDNKQNEWNEKRKEERHHNLKVASGNETDESVKAEKQKNVDVNVNRSVHGKSLFSPIIAGVENLSCNKSSGICLITESLSSQTNHPMYMIPKPIVA